MPLRIDLQIAEQLAIRRSDAGGKRNFRVFERLGIQLAQFAGTLADPAVALGIDGDIVRLGAETSCQQMSYWTAR